MSEDVSNIELSKENYPKINMHFSEENVIEVVTYHLKKKIDAIAIAHKENNKSKIENLIKNGFEFAKELLETKSVINANIKNSPRIRNSYERLYPNFDNYFEKFTAILLEDLGKNLLSHIVNGETKLYPEIKRVVQKNAVALRDLILEFQSQSPLNNNGVTYNEALKFCQKAIKDSGVSNKLLKNPTGDETIDNSRTYGKLAMIVAALLILIGGLIGSTYPVGIGIFIFLFSIQFVLAGK